MYTFVWKKYVPVIRILLKRALQQEQSFDLNSSDFEMVSPSRKASYRFTIQFINGKMGNTVGKTHISRDFIEALLEDEVVKDLFVRNNYSISMSPKFQLGIRHLPK